MTNQQPLEEEIPAAMLAGAPAARREDEDEECTCLFAVVAANGTLARGHRVQSVTRVGVGQYQVRFGRSVRDCAYVATIGDPASGFQAPGEIEVASHPNDNNVVVVFTINSQGNAFSDRAFHLVVVCSGDDD